MDFDEASIYQQLRMKRKIPFQVENVGANPYNLRETGFAQKQIGHSSKSKVPRYASRYFNGGSRTNTSECNLNTV